MTKIHFELLLQDGKNDSFMLDHKHDVFSIISFL